MHRYQEVGKRFVFGGGMIILGGGNGGGGGKKVPKVCGVFCEWRINGSWWIS